MNEVYIKIVKQKITQKENKVLAIKEEYLMHLPQDIKTFEVIKLGEDKGMEGKLTLSNNKQIIGNIISYSIVKD